MRELLPLSFIVLSVGLWIMTKRLSLGKDVTISLHAASGKKIQIFFSFLLSIVSVLISLFAFWLDQRYSLQGILALLFLLGVGCVLIAAGVPDVEGLSRKVHRIAAYCIVAIIPVVVGLLLSAKLSLIAMIWSVLVEIMLLTLCFMLIFVHEARKYFLFYQFLYLGLFFSVLLVASYL